jgi:hypothetical protein
MAKFLTVILLLAVFAGVVVLAFGAWRRRIREQFNAVAAPLEFFADVAGNPVTAVQLASAKAQYVATTMTDEPLNRVTAHGLGFRGRATVSVTSIGLLIERKGERSIALPNQQIVKIGFVQATIDRAVEKDGLVAIDWLSGRSELTTVLRFNSAADRNLILQASQVLARKANK